jgi:hypothetical protein
LKPHDSNLTIEHFHQEWYIAFMAIRKIPVPFCDVCGEPWLPKHRAADGTVNPLFEKPEKSKRCGKCKSTRWNAAGVDRRRKAVVDSPAEVPQVTIDDVRATVCGLSENPSPALLEALNKTARAAASRCKHGLYSCPECHHQGGAA